MLALTCVQGYCSDHWKNVEEFRIRLCFGIFFVFHAKPATAKPHQNGSSDISF